MKEQKRVPMLRFVEYSDEWLTKTLGEIGTVSMCKRIMKDQTSEIGDIPFFKIGTFGKTPDAFIDKNLYKSYKTKYSFPKKGDILISASGTIGRTVIYNGEPAYFQDSNIVWIDNNELIVLNKLLAYLYENVNWNTENTTIARLYNDNLRSIVLTFPSLPEQQKISSFLSTVDKKIKHLKDKLNLVEDYKKGVMQQIFPSAGSGQAPKLRFTRKDGSAYPDWEEKRLGEVAVFLDNERKPIKSSDRLKMKGKYPYYGASGIIDYVNEFIFDDELILLGEDGENIISRNLPLAYRISGKCWVNNHAHVIKPIAENNIDFLTYALEKINYEKYNTGTAQPKLNKEVCSKIPLKIPSPEEQTQIAHFLSAIDKKITVVQTQIEHTQLFKKGLLQQMFV